LNLEKGREELVDIILTQARHLSADLKCCRVLITVTDPIAAADLQKGTN
jgi:hypothetical protein